MVHSLTAVPGWTARPPGPVLADVLPAVAQSLGVNLGRVTPPAVVLPPAARVVVVLVDGLGMRLLERRSGHAPFLRGLLPTAPTDVQCGFPSTTATSMGSFGTGLAAGQHGLVGFEVRDPQTGEVFNELSWEHGPVPELWQPHRTVLESVEAAGIPVTRIGPAFFDGSGLTRAALRGGRFVAAKEPDDRVDRTVAAVRATPRALVYLYWGEVDKIGHVHGPDSWQWGDEVAAVDAALADLANRVPRDTVIVITADHGMVEVDHSRRIDVAHRPDLTHGIRKASGEPRALMLHTEEGATQDVADRYAAAVGADAHVFLRDQLIDEGLFGPVDLSVRDRIGDVLVLATGDFEIVDSGRMRPELLALRGMHGSLDPDEVSIPLLVTGPALG